MASAGTGRTRKASAALPRHHLGYRGEARRGGLPPSRQSGRVPAVARNARESQTAPSCLRGWIQPRRSAPEEPPALFARKGRPRGGGAVPCRSVPFPPVRPRAAGAHPPPPPRTRMELETIKTAPRGGPAAQATPPRGAGGERRRGRRRHAHDTLRDGRTDRPTDRPTPQGRGRLPPRRPGAARPPLTCAQREGPRVRRPAPSCSAAAASSPAPLPAPLRARRPAPLPAPQPAGREITSATCVTSQTPPPSPPEAAAAGRGRPAGSPGGEAARCMPGRAVLPPPRAAPCGTPGVVVPPGCHFARRRGAGREAQSRRGRASRHLVAPAGMEAPRGQSC